MLFSLPLASAAQTCIELGQTPQTAFPVCGTNVFRQENVPYCSTKEIIVPGCDPSRAHAGFYQNKNPYYYKFTAFQDGVLSFTINPQKKNEDYDWQLFDVTGRDREDIFADPSLVVTGNWAGNFGQTGASKTGVEFIQCASDTLGNEPRFAKSPQLKKGHDYLLMISHFSDTPSGYDLIFTEGTLLITDTAKPVMTNAKPVCGGQQIRIKLNKKLKCSSLAPDGSDFSINGPSKIVSATAPLCSNGFDMDTILVNLDQPLPAGKYTLSVKKGTDGNTMLDYCDDAMAEGVNYSFDIIQLVPAKMDSVAKTGCKPSSINLYFDKPIQCNSLQADGSNFWVTGPAAVNVIAASATCNDGGSAVLNVKFDRPVVIGGNYTVGIKPGLDGNTLVDECGMYLPLNNFQTFAVADTVSGAFRFNKGYDCVENKMQFLHDGYGGITKYEWQFSPGGKSGSQNPAISMPIIPSATAALKVTNQICTDSSGTTIQFDNYMKAVMHGPAYACPNEEAVFSDSSVGNVVRWHWDFGNGNTSNLQQPPPQFYQPGGTDYTSKILLTIYNSYNCPDTVSMPITIVRSCYIAVPSAFSPNGDGINDLLYPLVAYKTTALTFQVFNRFGERVFYSTDWTKKWNGKIRGRDADVGTYVWMLNYTDDKGKKVAQKGSTVLIR